MQFTFAKLSHQAPVVNEVNVTQSAWPNVIVVAHVVKCVTHNDVFAPHELLKIGKEKS